MNEVADHGFLIQHDCGRRIGRGALFAGADPADAEANSLGVLDWESICTTPLCRCLRECSIVATSMAYNVITERSQKPRSGIALGGIGCGCFELRQDGQFCNWHIFNNLPVGRGPLFTKPNQSVLFFVIRFQVEGEEPHLRLLQIEESHNSAGIAGHEFQYIFPWLQGMDRIGYSATFPFVRLDYYERETPLEISLEAWSPFIPRDQKNSSLPAAYFDFSVRSTSARPVTVTILASMRNWVGYDVREKAWTNRILAGEGFQGFEMSCADMNPAHGSFGSMGVASLHPGSRYHCGWGHWHPYYESLLRDGDLGNVDHTADRNEADIKNGRPWAKHDCFSSIGRTVLLDHKGAGFEHSFVATWDFPNRYGRAPDEPDTDRLVGWQEPPQPLNPEAAGLPLEGHFYSNFFRSSGEVAAYAAEAAARLRGETRKFHDAFFASSLPGYVLDQVNSHLNTFRTSSWFTKAGNFGIIEGLSPTRAFAGLATTDVAMYGGVATASLFPDLEKAVILAHRRFQNGNGSVVHLINFNFSEKDPREADSKRLDMPGQYASMALRSAFWTGDRDFLEEIWPSVKAALDYVLRERDANGDCLPDMEGIMCSYDNFPMFGIAPFVASQWLLALRSAMEAARLLGDEPALETYARAFEKGLAAFEEAGWNGRYYRLFNDVGGSKGTDEGCLTDQVIGQWGGHLVGLAPLFDSARTRKALGSILRMNFKPSQGLRNCQWPGDSFLHDVDKDTWVDQANTCWTGVELGFAALLLYEGMVKEALDVVQNVDDRHRRWGIYWDHQEFGGHYYRAMSSWSIIHAALGLAIRDGVVSFDPKVTRDGCRLLFVTSDCYGHYEETEDGIVVRVLSGRLKFRQLRFRKPEGAPRQGWTIQINGTAVEYRQDGDCLVVDWPGKPAQRKSFDPRAVKSPAPALAASTNGVH